MKRTDRQLLEEIRDLLLVVKANTVRSNLNERIQSMTLDDLKTKVEANRQVTSSAVTLLNGLAQQIRDAAQDPVKLQELADAIDADSQELAAAVSANTPGQPVTPA